MRTLTLLVVIALAGCGTIANTAFDATEASRYADIATTAHNLATTCDDVKFVRSRTWGLVAEASAAVHYSEVKVNDARVVEAGNTLLMFTNDLNTRYAKTDPSAAYCTLKLGIIEQAADIIARSISKKETNAPFVIP